jgi:hypothetical protein
MSVLNENFLVGFVFVAFFVSTPYLFLWFVGANS